VSTARGQPTIETNVGPGGETKNYEVPPVPATGRIIIITITIITEIIIIIFLIIVIIIIIMIVIIIIIIIIIIIVIIIMIITIKIDQIMNNIIKTTNPFWGVDA